MSRIRTIKPDFWQHPKVTSVSRDARLYFLGLLNEADDAGRLRYSGKRLAGVLFPEDEDVTCDEVNRWTCELEKAGLVHYYTVDDAPLLLVIGFTEHQRINRPSESKLPAPLTEGSWTDQGGEREDSSSEGEQGGAGTRGSRIPDEFIVTDDMQAWVERECPTLDWRRHTKRFVNYWKSTPGRKGVKLDWKRTWENWMLGEVGA